MLRSLPITLPKHPHITATRNESNTLHIAIFLSTVLPLWIDTFAIGHLLALEVARGYGFRAHR